MVRVFSFLATLALLIGACTAIPRDTVPEPRPERVTILYTHHAGGILEPCG